MFGCKMFYMDVMIYCNRTHHSISTVITCKTPKGAVSIHDDLYTGFLAIYSVQSIIYSFISYKSSTIMCIYIQNSSDNNQAQCTLVHVAGIQQRFSVSSQRQAKDCHGLRRKVWGFLLKYYNNHFARHAWFKMPNSVLTNATSNYSTHMRITQRKYCLMTHYVSIHERQPSEALRKLVYILSNERSIQPNS